MHLVTHLLIYSPMTHYLLRSERTAQRSLIHRAARHRHRARGGRPRQRRPRRGTCVAAVATMRARGGRNMRGGAAERYVDALAQRGGRRAWVV